MSNSIHAAPAGQPTDWQPIDTAKKDGEAHLVWCPDQGNIYVVSWTDVPHPAGYYHCCPGGFLLREEPTHWLPLPSPPETTP